MAVKNRKNGTSPRKSSRSRRAKRKGLTFNFFLLVCLMLAGIGVFILAQHQWAVNSEIETQKVDERIEAEKTKQKNLRIKLARLKSPDRIARLAVDELGMSQPDAVIYMRYELDESGNIVCRSSMEKKKKTPQPWENGREAEQQAPEESSPTMTRR